MCIYYSILDSLSNIIIKKEEEEEAIIVVVTKLGVTDVLYVHYYYFLHCLIRTTTANILFIRFTYYLRLINLTFSYLQSIDG